MTKIGCGGGRAYNPAMVVAAPKPSVSASTRIIESCGEDATHYFSVILNVTFCDRYFPVILTVTIGKLPYHLDRLKATCEA
jgi:hypothetical protein